MKNRILKIACLCAVTITVMLFSVFAANAALSGDVSGDGAITADDARTVLRVSVSLDKLTDEMMLIADVDEDGKVSAADARDVLRMSVSLDPIVHYYKKEVTLEPTCTTSGTLLKTCTECDEAPFTVEIEALGHENVVEAIEVVTCDKDGLEKHTCSRCGNVEEIVIPLGHIWNIPTSTCTEDQYCTRGNHIGEAKKGHTTQWGKCTRCNIFNTEKYASQAATLKAKIPEAITAIDTGYTYINESIGAATWLQIKATKAKPQYEKAKAAYKAAYDVCGDIPEFSAIKTNLLNALTNTDKILAAIDTINAEKYVNSENYESLIATVDTPQWATERINKNLQKAITW